MDGDIYTDFVEEVLLPHLIPFDGRNPHSVVILDNCCFHHCEEAESAENPVDILYVSKSI